MYCIYFSGSFEDTCCRAGVPYAMVSDTSLNRGGSAHLVLPPHDTPAKVLYPCVLTQAARSYCPKRIMRLKNGQLEQAIQEERCPICRRKTTIGQEVFGLFTAYPCHHKFTR